VGNRRYLANVPLPTLILELGHESLAVTQNYLADVRKPGEAKKAAMRHCGRLRLMLPILLSATTMAIAQSRAARAQAPTSPQYRTTKPSSLPEEDKLRIRLQFNPHDAKAHKQLIELLDGKYAFRAKVIEDATWVKNNPSDSFALTELVSTSEVALHDPEYAIAQLRSYLSTVRRADDSENYDFFAAQLAAKLRERNRPEEALPLNTDLVRLNPNDAGLWADYADAPSSLGRNAEAVQALHHSIDLDPSMDITHEVLAETLLKSGGLRWCRV
jgi:tetratricopeptide (TPR) repeat protein